MRNKNTEKRRQQIMDSWRRWAERNPEKIKEKSRRNAQRQKEERHAEIAKRPRCLVCGEPFKGRSLTSRLTLSIGFHRKCDPTAWMTEYRHQKQN